MKKMLCAVLACVTLFAAAACSSDKEQTDGTSNMTDMDFSSETQISYDALVLSEYIADVKYRDLGIALTGDNSKDQALLWQAIYDGATVIKYPEDKVRYYFNQTKMSYMYMVDYKSEDYELLLQERGISEEDMMDKARQMVKEDMVYRYILTEEGISLTETERTENFDKYVSKLAAEFGCSEEYMRTEMSEYVYEVMLRDKTTECLLELNK